jgi:hypothetical protein
MQIKLEMVFSNLDEDHIIEVPDGSDFLTIFGAITKAMRDECIYEDEIQSISFWCLGSKLGLLRVLNGDPS